MAEGEVVLGSIYVYAPNKVAPIVFSVLFGISAIGHNWQCWRNNSWKMTGLHAFCAVLFTVGYALREYGAFNYMFEDKKSSQMTLGVYIASQVFIYICPPLLELGNYHILSRTFHYIPSEAPIPPGRVLTIFAPVMMIVETLNSLGIAFTSNPTSSEAQAGKILVLAAIGIQICLILTFFTFAGIFHWRCSKNEVQTKAIPTLPIVMYLSMSLILIRSIYRMVEHAGNSAMDIHDLQTLQSLSPLMRYEWYFYVFEGATMLANSVLWNVWHASRYLPRTKNYFIAEDGVTEMVWDQEDDTSASMGQTGSESIIAKTAYGAMQILTLGVWGHVFPRKQSVLHQNQKDSLISEDSDRHV
ncbi:hypothetical protein PENSTE_c003G04047 [Penicillium steckii]|uniref:RTA1 domain protein n=1 Tax=Penicillium steckii TaxID=303698 RepID=A0A1V6TSQ9_9EURO|nr:hypothetical protein PENSTE_c003G04047 [Penicillium steckii]